jgi:hypothetical protein
VHPPPTWLCWGCLHHMHLVGSMNTISGSGIAHSCTAIITWTVLGDDWRGW